MSTAENSVMVVEAPAAEADHNHHDPNLAHHFDTPEQQSQTAKLGMWAFLATEILMFGGLFCAYAVYRHNHPEIFEYAHQYLNRWLGAVNTLVLITSSLTMAWGVRAAQMGKKNLLVVMLALTILGAFGFMFVKTIEYTSKWKEQIFIGQNNLFYKDAAETRTKVKVEELQKDVLHVSEKAEVATATAATTAEPADPNKGTGDEAKIVPPNVTPMGLAPQQAAESHKMVYEEMGALERHRVYTFFAIYFFMTGLHGLHVTIGIGLITWIMIRAQKNEFGPTYFTPVDLVGLYWHLVDLIWIFLFPLLYLIH